MVFSTRQKSSLLTDTLSWISREAGAVVTFQAMLLVTHQYVSAGFSFLPGTHSAASTSVQDESDAIRADWHRSGTLAWLHTLLTACLKRQTGSDILPVIIRVFKWGKFWSLISTSLRIFIFLRQMARTSEQSNQDVYRWRAQPAGFNSQNTKQNKANQHKCIYINI